LDLSLKPAGLRPISCAMTRHVFSILAVLAAAFAVAGGPAAPTAAARLSHTERRVISLINGIRAQNGLGHVRASRVLTRAAESHTSDMLRHDFFEHWSSNGTSFNRRVRRYVHARMVGETLATLAQRRGGAATVVQMWMGSPSHRAVLLSGGFRRIGIARRWGMLGSAGQSVVTADFASG
jgi:uncharacterized protein YkwD